MSGSRKATVIKGVARFWPSCYVKNIYSKLTAIFSHKNTHITNTSTFCVPVMLDCLHPVPPNQSWSYTQGQLRSHIEQPTDLQRNEFLRHSYHHSHPDANTYSPTHSPTYPNTYAPTHSRGTSSGLCLSSPPKQTYASVCARIASFRAFYGNKASDGVCLRITKERDMLTWQLTEATTMLDNGTFSPPNGRFPGRWEDWTQLHLILRGNAVTAVINGTRVSDTQAINATYGMCIFYAF